MKPQEVILIGGGGHALSLAEFAEDSILGYLSPEASEKMPGEWLGSDADREQYIAKGKFFHVAYIYSGLPGMSSRRKLIDIYEGSGARFVSLLSPASIISPRSEIGEGCAVMAGAIVNRARLGNHVVVNSGAIVEHDCEIGDNTFIAPGAVIGGFTKIGSNCFIGLGANIGNGLMIGDNVTVAMGATVRRDLKEPGLYHGEPLRRFKI